MRRPRPACSATERCPPRLLPPPLLPPPPLPLPLPLLPPRMLRPRRLPRRPQRPPSQPPRRQRRGRRRRGVYDEEAESRPSRTALAEPDTIRINSGSTVKDVAEYLDVSASEIIKQLMALGEMKTLTQTLSDEAIVELS